MAAVFGIRLSPLKAFEFLIRHDRRRLCPAAALIFFCAGVGGDIARGQEALRASIAGAEASAERRKRVTTIGYYNIRLGDTLWRFSAGVGLEYNDNVNLAQTNAASDYIASPSLNTSMFWPVSDRNALNLSLDVGYAFYATRSDLNRLYITPGSEISFDVFVKDLVINFHDRPSLAQYSYQNPSVTGTGDYAQFQNAAGVSVAWDLNKAQANFGFDHVNYLTISSSTASPDGNTDSLYAQVGAYFWPELQLGLEAGAGNISYSSTNTPNAFQWNLGTFAKYQASEYLSFRASVGYTVYSPEKTGAFVLLTDTTLIYVDLSLTHRLNKYLSYTLSGSRGVNLSFFGQTYENYDASLVLEWHLLRKIGLRTPFSYQHGSEISGAGEVFSQFQTGISLDRPLTEKLSTGLTYHVAIRNSQTAGHNYTVNSVSLNFNYRF